MNSAKRLSFFSFLTLGLLALGLMGCGNNLNAKRESEIPNAPPYVLNPAPGPATNVPTPTPTPWPTPVPSTVIFNKVVFNQVANPPVWESATRRFNRQATGHWKAMALSTAGSQMDYRFIPPAGKAYAKGDPFKAALSNSTEGSDDITSKNTTLCYSLTCNGTKRAYAGSCEIANPGNISGTNFRHVLLDNQRGWQCCWNGVHSTNDTGAASADFKVSVLCGE